MSSLTPSYRERPGCHPGVAAVWTLASSEATPSLVAADGCFDLILCTSPGARPSGFIYHPEARATVCCHRTHSQFHGVRLRPGYGAALNSGCKSLTQAAEADGDPATLEALVIATLEEAGPPPHVVVDFLERARDAKGAVRLTSNTARPSERELQRACRRWLGLAPKAFLRIERAWAARATIRSGQPLAAVAADLGYADQAHLTRELRCLLGVTPRQLRPVGILQDPSPLQR